MKLLKRIAFCLLGILLFVLTIATILEKVNGTEFVNNHIYSSVPFIILWGSTALASLLYMIKRKLHRQWTTFLLHLSFILILVGAFVTWIDGEQGTLQLKLGEKTMSFINKGGEKRTLPFSISLEDFEIIYYKGTRAPMDYVSRITVSAENNSESLEGEISMNKIFSFMNYRFYQSGYDANGQGTVLSVSHDPYGIGITYTGYSILLVSIILFFLNPQSTFRQLMKSYRNNSQDIKRDAASYSCCLSPPFRWEAGQWLPTIPCQKLSHAKQPDASVTFISCTTTVSAPCKLSQEILQSSYMANRHITALPLNKF